MDNYEKTDKVVEYAFSLGVSDAKIMVPGLIPVDNRFPRYCKEPGCPGYGRSMSCPPNVKGPDWFRKYLKKFNHALVFKFDVPSTTLLSQDRHDVTRLIHETASGIERFAVDGGFKNSKGFAGGSCKELFCGDYNECRVVAGKGECRNPAVARQSMSGMGVDFLKLTKLVNWKMNIITKDTDPDEIPMGFMAGLVLLG